MCKIYEIFAVCHIAVCGLIAQSCLTLCDHMEYSWPGSSALRILQARILEGVIHSFL